MTRTFARDGVGGEEMRRAHVRVRAQPSEHAAAWLTPEARRTRTSVVQGRATKELNVGTFVWVTTVFCVLQFPLRLVPELVFASFGFARLLPQLERAFPYLLFGWLGHEEFSQGAGPALGRRHKRLGPPGHFYLWPKQPIR